MWRKLLTVAFVVGFGCGDNRGAALDASHPLRDGAAIDARGADAATDAPGDASPDAAGICTAAPCAVGEPCAIDTDCVSAACDTLSHTCVADPCFDHHRDRLEADVDCGDHVCADCATGLACTAANQCVDDACDGDTSTCASDPCIDHLQDNGESDVDCGGPLGVCARCRPGKACTLNADCQSGLKCLGNVCERETCANHTLDTGETDVDCGGLFCTGCAVGGTCASASDCASRACNATSHQCVASACTDGVKDGDETAADCGGAICPTCAAGGACTRDGDCASGACDSQTHTCVTSSCTDHHRDGAESGIDCGGTSSCGTCANGYRCNSNSDCTSHACDPTIRACVMASCIDHVLDGTEVAIDCGGACAPCGADSPCVIDQDCGSGACDAISNTCIAAQCNDHHQEVNESAVDCGGTCTGCALDVACRDGSDCASHTCDPGTHLCRVPYCEDHVKEGNETDVDCGGSCPTACALTQGCLLDGDCVSGACDAVSMTCVADACFDHRLDLDETGTDCGGTTCAARCAAGARCNHDTDCDAGHTCAVTTPHVCL